MEKIISANGQVPQLTSIARVLLVLVLILLLVLMLMQVLMLMLHSIDSNADVQQQRKMIIAAGLIVELIKFL